MRRAAGSVHAAAAIVDVVSGFSAGREARAAASSPCVSTVST